MSDLDEQIKVDDILDHIYSAETKLDKADVLVKAQKWFTTLDPKTKLFVFTYLLGKV